MDAELKYSIFDTKAGWMGILGSIRGLRCITLPQHSAEEARQLLSASLKHASISSSLFEDLIKRLRAYFEGDKVDFADVLDLQEASPFQCEVWHKTRLIPYGETRSYLWVAEQIGKPKAARGVGHALSRNPLPIIIPCHRVIASNGSLRGFRGGLEMKGYLLSLESTAK